MLDFLQVCHNIHTRVKLELKLPRSTLWILGAGWRIRYTCLLLGNAYLELPKASVAESLAKKFGTISGRVRRFNAAAAIAIALLRHEANIAKA